VIPRIELPGGLNFDPALYLAPMEGVTDRSFRGLVLERNPGALGAACTEFMRVSQHPIPVDRFRLELAGDGNRGVSGGKEGDQSEGGSGQKISAGQAAVGVQLMGNQPAVVAQSSIHAAEAGADFVDLNFGCPAPKVFQHCAGSALLADPPLLEKLVAATVAACPVPVTAKIRAGIEDDRQLEDIARRVEQAGAVLLTVHARLRIQSYRELPQWERISRAVAAVQIPVIGNGSADNPAEIDRMFAQTGCAGVMVGRAAIGNPWIFGQWLAARSDIPFAQPDARQWLQDYGQRMLSGGALPGQALGRLKQALKAMIQADLLPGEFRTDALRSANLDDFHAILNDSIRL
jgi:tRNA-dihydrouridine synthase